MMSFASTLWKWLVNRSPQNATMPNRQPWPSRNTVNKNQQPGTQPIETNLNLQSVIGLLSGFCTEDSLLRSADGGLVRVNDKRSLQLGCGHIVTQVQAVDEKGRHIKGIAGPCEFCLEKYGKLLAKGQINALDAERLSLTCTDCGKITTSGCLGCPKHYTKDIGPDGQPIYLDKEHAKQIRQQDTVQTALSVVNCIFGESHLQIPDRHDKEQKDAPNPISIHLGHIIHYGHPTSAESAQESISD